jgi:membrane protein
MVASGFDQIVIQAEDHSATPTLASQPASLAAGKINLADQIESLVAKAEAQLTFQRIGPIGAVLLIWTATGLLATLERALNRIFGARESRGIAKRLILYWAALTLGPLVLSAAAFLGGRMIAAIGGSGGWAWILAISGWVGPAIVGILVVATLYKLLPNTLVRYRAAVGGALIAVPLWMLAKWGFSLYVTKFVGTGNLYGALGLIPLFLIWLNLSWTILLFGAQLAHTATNLDSFEQDLQTADVEIAPLDLLAAAIAVADAYQSGAGPVPVAHVAKRLHTTDRAGRGLLDRLTDAGLLCPIANGEQIAYVLARPADKIAVLDIVGLNRRLADGASAAPADDIQRRVAGLQQHAADSLGHLTLADALKHRA